MVKERFIQQLIKELNEESKWRVLHENKKPLDVCYMVSVVDQQIENYQEFMHDLQTRNWLINGYDEDTTGGYTNGKIGILIEKTEEEKEYRNDVYEDYCYYIEFLYDERHWGYCECSADDEGYNEKHKCCGNGCDWDAPAFRITKEINMGYSTWKGQQRDYWEYEERFNLKQENKNKEVEEHQKQQKKARILEEIQRLQDELALL